MSRSLVCFLWITGVLMPVMVFALVLFGKSVDEAAAAGALLAMAAAEVAVRLDSTGAGGAGGSPALGPALA